VKMTGKISQQAINAAQEIVDAAARGERLTACSVSKKLEGTPDYIGASYIRAQLRRIERNDLVEAKGFKINNKINRFSKEK